MAQGLPLDGGLVRVGGEAWEVGVVGGRAYPVVSRVGRGMYYEDGFRMLWGGDGRLRLGKHQWVRVGSWWVRGLGETRDNVLVGAGYELEVGRFSYGIYGVGSEVRLGRVDSAMVGM